jgi:RNA polymerase sigma factor (sigma-70 family)
LDDDVRLKPRRQGRSFFPTGEKKAVTKFGRCRIPIWNEIWRGESTTIRYCPSKGVTMPQGNHSNRDEETHQQAHLEDLLRRAVNGDELARNELLLALLPRVRGQVTRSLNGPCRDARSDVVCSVVRRLCACTAAHYPPTLDHFRRWVGRIVGNRCIDEWRRWFKRMEQLPSDVPDGAQDSRLLLVWPALQLLPDRHRQVLEQTFYEDKSSRQIGVALGLREGTVNVIRHRALKKLGALLEKCDDHQ